MGGIGGDFIAAVLHAAQGDDVDAGAIVGRLLRNGGDAETGIQLLRFGHGCQVHADAVGQHHLGAGRCQAVTGLDIHGARLVGMNRHPQALHHPRAGNPAKIALAGEKIVLLGIERLGVEKTAIKPERTTTAIVGDHRLPALQFAQLVEIDTLAGRSGF